MATNLMQDNPGVTASKNIINIINAAAEAQKAQTDLKKEVMLHQIQQKMDLQANAEKLHQANAAGIEGQNMQMDWMKNLGGGDNSTPTASAPNGLGQNGVATSATPGQTGSAPASPMASVVSPTQPPAPANAPTPTPMLSAAAQPKPQSPMLQGITPPAMGAPQPQAPAQPAQLSAQYQNLGYPPIEGPALLAQRKAAGQTVNHADAMYAMALNKVKQGTASQGEIDMVNKMNNKDASAPEPTPPGQPTPTPYDIQAAKKDPIGSKISQGLRNFEQQAGWPEGSAMYNPAAKPGEVPVMMSPIYKSKIEAQNKYDIEAPDRYGRLADQDLMHIFSMRSGALGIQDAKINQAMHLKQLFDQTYDPKTRIYNLKSPHYAEATQGLAVLVSNSNQTSEGQRDEIKQRTLKGDYNGALTYALGIPKNATSQEIVKMYMDSIDRQGLAAQTIKEKDLADIKNLDSFRQLAKVAPDRADNLYKAKFGIDYREYIKMPWEDRVKMVTGEAPMNNSDIPSGTGPMNDNNSRGGAGKLYGGMSVADAKAQGYTGFDTEKNQWVK